MTTLTTDLLAQLRTRRTAGESVKFLAAEVGYPSWQKLDKAIRNGLPKHGRPVKVPPSSPSTPARRPAADPHAITPRRVRKVSETVLTPTCSTGPLTERYRPATLDQIRGQDQAVAVLTRFAAQPHPAAFILEGETGTGKTTAALALANALGCRVDQNEFGGVNTVASGEQTADTVRAIWKRMWLSPLMGSGWKVLIVNEADRMSPAAENIWLDCLEHIPAHTVVVFTTNFAGRLSQRFLDRSTRLTFEADAAKLGMDAYGLLCGIWRSEAGTDPDMTIIANLVEGCKVDGKHSFRRLIQSLTPILMTMKSSRKSA